MTHIVFKSIRVINPATSFDEISDVIIKKNKIVSILKYVNLDTLVKKDEAIIYDCNGLSMAPGIIDMRVNLGKTENLELTQKIAVQHGITSMVVLPNQTPRLDDQ